MITLNRMGAGCCAKWSRAPKVLASSLHAKIYADRKEASNNKPLDFLSNYNEQATKRILHVLNNTSAQDLGRYDVSKVRTRKIAKYRESKGPFESIEQVLEVDDFGAKILEKLVASIMKGASGTTVEQDLTPFLKILNNLTIPVLKKEKRSTVNTVTGICLGRRNVSWAKIDESGRLVSWDSYTNFELPKKDNPMILLDLALKLRKMLPASDIYVTEAPAAHQGNTNTQQSAMIGKMQCSELTTMLITLLATQFDYSNEDGEPSWTQIDNCYFLRRQVPAILFRLLVGYETVSACQVIDQILDDTITETLSHIPPITIDDSAIAVYDKSDSVKKEALSQALILSFAFMDLAVKCNTLGLKAIEGNRSRKMY